MPRRWLALVCSLLHSCACRLRQPCGRSRFASRRIPKAGRFMFAQSSLLKLIFGRLTFDAFPIHEPILVVTFLFVATGGIAVLGAITYFRLWGYLWSEGV